MGNDFGIRIGDVGCFAHVIGQIEQRQVILLVGLEGMDYEGTAKILNVPIGTVRSRLSRGRAELRKLMGYIEGPENAPAEAQEYCVQKRAA